MHEIVEAGDGLICFTLAIDWCEGLKCCVSGACALCTERSHIFGKSPLLLKKLFFNFRYDEVADRISQFERISLIDLDKIEVGHYTLWVKLIVGLIIKYWNKWK